VVDQRDRIGHVTVVVDTDLSGDVDGVPGTDRSIAKLAQRILQKQRLPCHDHTSNVGLMEVSSEFLRDLDRR
jgi:hypothetical protein